MDEYEYDSSEGEYDDNSSYDEQDEFYGDDHEDMEGGAYQLDYIDGMYGMGDGGGYGGVMYGGGSSKWTKFYSSVAKKGYTMAEASVFYRQGAKLRDIPKKPGYAKKVVVKRPGGKKCAANGRVYAYPANYDKYCISRKSGSKSLLRNPVQAKICAEKGLHYCPLTGRCRKRETIRACYNKAGIPYYYNKSTGNVVARYNKSTGKYLTAKQMENYRDRFPESKLYRKRRVIKKKT